MQLGFGQIVPPPIDLDYQLGAVMDEIDDVAAHRSLTPDVEVELTKRFPKDAFTNRHSPP